LGASAEGAAAISTRLGFTSGQVVQELGYDDDVLVDSLASLADGGVVWLLTPKSGRPGHVEPSDIGEAAPTAGLAQTSSISAAPDWSGTRLVSPKAARGKR
jgi:hypothetical protein